jgi:hypothetical protein
MPNSHLAIRQRNDELPGPGAWELFLLGERVSETNCALLLAGQSRKGRAIRSWVRDHYSTKFVPENILEALGLRKRLRVRWQKENPSHAGCADRTGAFHEIGDW